MNNEKTQKLRGVVELLLENSSRINEAKPEKYWYPLSMATYGIEEIMEAIDSMCSFRTSMWEKTAAFERDFAAYQECKHAIMVNSGSSADLLMCFAMTMLPNPILPPGSEVLLPVVTWPTQIWSAMMAGLKVKLVDVDPHTLNIDLEDLNHKITAETRAIFLVHLMGLPCEMTEIQELASKHKLILLEDCCEALGSACNFKKVGNFGLASTFSFFFSHHMTTMEGGVICTNDDNIADKLRILRAHGWTRNLANGTEFVKNCTIDPRYTFVNWGFNVRPTELQAGFGLHQLKRLNAWAAIRREMAAEFYDTALKSSPYVSCPNYASNIATPVWFALPLLISPEAPFSRDEITSKLEDKGIETRPIVAGNVARHPAADLFPEFSASVFPGADVIHDRGFYIGLSPMTSTENWHRLLRIVSTTLKTYSGIV
jgi:CDP-6-deoxy-D-xylo-4-hexulose-3-dehydrase